MRDLTGGFKCFRREVLEAHRPRRRSSAPATRSRSSSPTARYRRGFRVAEVPIVFVDRRVGQSKMSRRIVLEAIRKVWSIRASGFDATRSGRSADATSSSRSASSSALGGLLRRRPVRRGAVLPRDDAATTRREKRRETALRAAVAAGARSSLFALAGAWVFRLLGISLGAFKMAGGVVLLLLALDMLRTQPSRTRITEAEVEAGAGKEDIAIVPLAMPLLAGPGSIATAIVLMARARSGPLVARPAGARRDPRSPRAAATSSSRARRAPSGSSAAPASPSSSAPRASSSSRSRSSS